MISSITFLRVKDMQNVDKRSGTNSQGVRFAFQKQQYHI